MSAIGGKADIGTGPRITFGAPAPAAWRGSPQSVEPVAALSFHARIDSDELRGQRNERAD